MKKCKHCMSEIDDKAKVCPHCGRRQPSKKRAVLWSIVAIICILIVIGVASGGNGNGGTEDQSQEPTDVVSKLSLGMLETVDDPQIGSGDFGVQVITGSIKNVSGRKLSYAQITFAIYDSDGNQIGTSVDNINDLTEDSLWKYTAFPLSTEQFSTFELTGVDAY